MKTSVWSFVLQYARVGFGAIVFLMAARLLSLAEIGLFATAFAPVRLAQGLHKAGIAETAVITNPRSHDTLFALSLSLGAVIAAILGLTAPFLPDDLGGVLLTLAPIPLLNGISAVSEGRLRKSFALRSLALRTLLAQGVAAALALFLLFFEAGVWALVGFALGHALLGSVLTLHMARWRPCSLPRRKYLSLILPKTAQISGRDLSSSALFPMMQLAISATLGLPAAGAFQIATRVLSLVDALTLAPVRYIALPQFAAQVGKSEFAHALRSSLHRTTLYGTWVWCGTLAAAPGILTLAAGPSHAEAAAPILRALVPLGLVSALSMPFNQALTAGGGTGLVLKRALLALVLGVTVASPALSVSAPVAAAGLSVGAVLAFAWYLRRALPSLGLDVADLLPLGPSLIAGATMAAMLILLTPDATYLTALAGQILAGSAIYACLVSVLTPVLRRRVLS